MAKDLRERDELKEVIHFEESFVPRHHNSHISACSNQECFMQCGRKTIMNIQMWFGSWVDFKPISPTECIYNIPVLNTKEEPLTKEETVDKVLKGNFGAVVTKVEIIQEDIFKHPPKPKSQFDDYL